MALRAEVDTATNLLEGVRSGKLDMAIIYDPPQTGGLVVELLQEERLMMVTTQADGTRGPAASYVHVDWGPAVQVGDTAQTIIPGVSISHGPLALLYILKAGGTGYFRHGAVSSFLAEGKLHRVADAPEFGYSAHLVYSNRAERALMEKLRLGFRRSSNSH